MEENNSLEYLTMLADKLVGVRDVKATQEEAVKQANREIEELETQMIEIMQTNDVHTFKHAGKTFYTNVQSFPKIADEDSFFAWLEENHEEGIIKRTINAQTLRSWYKQNETQFGEQLTAENLDGTPKMLEVFSRIRIGVRGA